MTTHGPTSSNCAADLRCEMWRKLNGLATVNAALMSSFIISMYAWYTPIARRASPLACRGGNRVHRECSYLTTSSLGATPGLIDAVMAPALHPSAFRRRRPTW